MSTTTHTALVFLANDFLVGTIAMFVLMAVLVTVTVQFGFEAAMGVLGTLLFAGFVTVAVLVLHAQAPEGLGNTIEAQFSVGCQAGFVSTPGQAWADGEHLAVCVPEAVKDNLLSQNCTLGAHPDGTADWYCGTNPVLPANTVAVVR